MASNSAITQVLETDIWVKATWEEFLNFAEDSAWGQGQVLLLSRTDEGRNVTSRAIARAS